MSWIVQVKGSRKEHHEISILKENNNLGFRSWRWGDLNKIILFGTGLGTNQLNPTT